MPSRSDRNFVSRCWSVTAAVFALVVGSYSWGGWESSLNLRPHAGLGRQVNTNSEPYRVVPAQFVTSQFSIRLPTEKLSRTVRLPPVIPQSVSTRLPDVNIQAPDAAMVSLSEQPLVHRLPAINALDAGSPVPTPNSLVGNWDDRASPLFAAQRQAEKQLLRARALAGRGATFSARADLESALVTLSQALDERDRTDAHRAALRTALLALEEASDFVRHHPRGQLSLDVESTIARHRCGAVAADEARGCTTADVVDQYFSFAREKFAEALGNSPIAAQALYGLGKLHTHLSESDPAAERVHAPRAIVLHETALILDNTQLAAAHELATLLVRAGRLPEARDVLRNAAVSCPSPLGWQLLADVHDRLGEPELARLARVEQSQSLLRAGGLPNGTTVEPNGLQIRWVDKSDFERAGYSDPAMASGFPAGAAVPRTARPTLPAGGSWR